MGKKKADQHMISMESLRFTLARLDYQKKMQEMYGPCQDSAASRELGKDTVKALIKEMIKN